MTFAQLLPMAFVMIAGPQILSAIFLATTENWRRNSAAFVLGASVSITAIVCAAYFRLDGAAGGDVGDDTLYWIVLALLLAAAISVYRTRETAEPPKWMGKLRSADAKILLQARLPAAGRLPHGHHHLDSRRDVPGGRGRPLLASAAFLSSLSCFSPSRRSSSSRSGSGPRSSSPRCATG